MTTKAYFTFADKITQDRMGERSIVDKRKRIERNLKASLLINNSLVFRSYAAIESDITESILLENISLLENGILIPEYRLQNEILSKEIDHHHKNGSKKVYQRKKNTAELIDSIPNKCMVDADHLSSSRSFCLALLLFRLCIYPNPYVRNNITTEDLIPVFDKLFNHGIPPRNSYVNDIKRIFKKQSNAINIIQSVYFGMGAHYTGANPVWTNEINPHKEENLKIWLSRQPELHTLSKSDLLVAKKFGITDYLEDNKSDIEYLNEVLTLNQHSEKIINHLKITNHDLDVLTIKDILEIRATKQHENFNSFITDNIHENDYGISLSRYYSEKHTFENREKTLETVCTVLGFIPLVGIFFHLIPATMKLFLNKQSKKELSKNLPLYSYSEAITDRIEALVH